MGGRLVDKAKSLYFQDGGAPLCLNMDELNAGWKVRAGTENQELNFAQVCRDSSSFSDYPVQL